MESTGGEKIGLTYGQAGSVRIFVVAGASLHRLQVGIVEGDMVIFLKLSEEMSWNEMVLCLVCSGAPKRGRK